MIKFGIFILVLLVGGMLAGPILFKEYSIKDAANPEDNESGTNQFLTALTPSVGPDVVKQGIDLQTALVIDVRSEDEYDVGHISGAANIPEQNLYQQIGEKFPQKTTLIYMYDDTGYGGAAGTRLLISMGYERVLNMEGGFNKWKNLGYKVESIYAFPD